MLRGIKGLVTQPGLSHYLLGLLSGWAEHGGQEAKAMSREELRRPGELCSLDISEGCC